MSPLARTVRPVLCALALVVAAPAWCEPAQVPERIEWNRVPIRLALTTGSERIVRFPGPVRVGVPAALQPLLRIQSLEDAVYFLARAPFDPARIVVRATANGQVFLLDVSAFDGTGARPPVEVYVRQAVPVDPGEPVAAGPVGYVALTRFAARQLYAPLRLAQGRPGMVRVPVHRTPVALLRGGAVQAVPLASWRAGALFVTAVRLTNRTAQPRTLDPRELRGTWLAATFQHNRLLPAGSEADTTAVYLVSDRAFEASRPQHGPRER